MHRFSDNTLISMDKMLVEPFLVKNIKIKLQSIYDVFLIHILIKTIFVSVEWSIIFYFIKQQ